MTSPQQNKRRELDVMKLLMSDRKVNLIENSTKEFEVQFEGPTDSPYEGGVWQVRVELPDEYPYKSPSIGFKNRLYHPNVDETAGSVCLDVINQTWSPMFDLVNIFETFLPQLLLYPNPTDPLNGEAAALLLREPEAYSTKVKDYVQRYATPPAPAKPAEPAQPSAAGKPRKMAKHGADAEREAGPGEQAAGDAGGAEGGDSDGDALAGLLSDSEDDDDDV